jgi:hypothetical protein
VEGAPAQSRQDFCNSSGSLAKFTAIRLASSREATRISTAQPPSLTKPNHLLPVGLRAVACAQQDVIIVEMLGLTVSIVDFKRAKLLQDAKFSGVTVNDIARAWATMTGVKAASDFDAGLTAGYFNKAETLLELAVEFAQERRRNNQ